MFRHAVGYVEFTTEKAGKIEFCGVQTDVLTGKVTVTGFDGHGYPELSYGKGNSMVSVEVDEPGTYYMACDRARHKYFYLDSGISFKPRF